MRTEILITTILLALLASPSNTQSGINELVASFQKSTPEEKFNLVQIIAFSDMETIQQLEGVFVRVYKLLNEEPKLDPEIMSNLVNWTLDELPKLLQNPVVHQIVHVFVNELNKADLSKVNRTNIFTIMHDVFGQMDWTNVILQSADKFLEPWITAHGINENVTSTVIPIIISEIESLTKDYLPKVLPFLVQAINEFNATMDKNTPNTGNTNNSFPFLVQLSKLNITQKLGLTKQFFLQNVATFDRLVNTAVAALPLLTEPPPLNDILQKLLLQWAFKSLPDLLVNEGFKRVYHIIVDAMNSANTTGLNATNEHEFINGILSQMDLLEKGGEIVAEIGITLAPAIGINPLTAKHLIPGLVRDVLGWLREKGKYLVMKVLKPLATADQSKLSDNVKVMNNVLIRLITEDVLPDILTKPTLQKVGLSVINKALQLPSLQKLEQIVLGLVPLIKPLSEINPIIISHLLTWAADNLPPLLRHPIVTDALKILTSAMNKVDLRVINSTNNDVFVRAVFKQLNVPDIIGDIATRVAIPLSVSYGLKLQTAVTMVPFLVQSLEKLVITDIKNVIGILVKQMNNVSTEDIAFNSTEEFIVTYFDRLEIRPIIAKLVSQPNILRLLVNVITKEPLVVWDLVKTIAGSFNVTSWLNMPLNVPLPPKCYGESIQFLLDLLHGEKWALKVLDSFGKPPSSILSGNIHLIGSYDECLSINSMDSAPNTKYCRASFTLPPSLVNLTLGDVNTFGVPFTLTWGMCVSAECHSDDIPNFFKLGILQQFGLKPTSVVCSDEKEALSEDTAAVAVIAIGSVVIAIIGLATIINGLQKKKNPKLELDSHNTNTYNNDAFVTELKSQLSLTETGKQFTADKSHINGINGHLRSDENTQVEKTSKIRKVLESFSILKNLKDLLSFERDPEEISCLYGIRAISMLWICVGNAYLYNAIWGGLADSYVIANSLSALDMLKRFSFQFVFNATLATDTFLMTSGFIITFKLLEKISKDGRLKASGIFLFFLKRFIRLTPVYMAILFGYSTLYTNVGDGPKWPKRLELAESCLLTPVYMAILFGYSTLYTYVGDGPTWPKRLELAESCRARWWYHLLYVNNLVDVQGNRFSEQCMPWSWFNAVIMQLNFITPILVILFLISYRLGFTISTLLLIGGMTATGVKEYKYGGDLLSSFVDEGHYWNSVFTAPWCRVTSYCIGVMLGFCIFIRGKQKADILLAWIGWIVSGLVGIALVFMTYLKYMDNAKEWSFHEQAAFESLSHPVWSCCVAWAIFACYNERGGIFNSLLSWKGFIPLSKLSYTMYLLNPVVIAMYIFSRRALVYVSDIDMIYIISSYYVLTLIGSLVMSLLFERPFISLMNTFRKSKDDSKEE